MTSGRIEKDILDGFALSVDPEGDLSVSIFIFGGKNAPPGNGIYFIMRVITATMEEETSSEVY
ncbi:hypothetical protein BDR04DRAFT_1086384 [Suillus decipiens]|nr:hypothetical protein BDR04DRAFT_1086384 [Suillus decipiens]